MSDLELLSMPELLEWLQIDEKQLRYWRRHGFPEPVRRGGFRYKSLWDRDEVRSWFRDTGLATGITARQVSLLTGLGIGTIGTYQSQAGESRTLFPAPRWKFAHRQRFWLLEDVLDWLLENNRDPGSTFIEPTWAWVLSASNHADYYLDGWTAERERCLTRLAELESLIAAAEDVDEEDVSSLSYFSWIPDDPPDDVLKIPLIPFPAGVTMRLTDEIIHLTRRIDRWQAEITELRQHPDRERPERRRVDLERIMSDAMLKKYNLEAAYQAYWVEVNKAHHRAYTAAAESEEDPSEVAPAFFGLTVLEPPLWDES